MLPIIENYFLEIEQIYIMIVVSVEFLEDVEMALNQEVFGSSNSSR